MDKLDEIDEAVRRMTACIASECAITNKRNLLEIAAKIRQAILDENSLSAAAPAKAA